MQDVVLFSGISGTNVSNYAEECVKYGNSIGDIDWEHIRFAKLMYELDPESVRLSYIQWEEGILKRSAILPLLRRSAFEKLLKIIKETNKKGNDGKKKITIVSTHTTFWYCKSLISGLDLTTINELNPSAFITIVDDVIDVWDRLINSKQSRWNELSPIDILEWREIETFFTEQMAYLLGEKYLPKPFYIISKRYPVTIIVKILSDPSIKKFYRSYPITFVNKRPEVKQESDRLEQLLSQYCILFDPMGILDLDRKNELQEKYKEWCKSHGYSEPSADWRDIENHLSYQTVSRDYRLINQSDGLVVYYPELEYFTKHDGKYIPTPLVPFSSGVLDEMHYATQLGKDIYLVWTSTNKPGPFLQKIYTKKFDTIEKLLEFAISLK